MAVIEHGSPKRHIDAYLYRRGVWSHSARFAPTGTSVSCPTRTFCAVLGADDTIHLWDGRGWRRAHTPVLLGGNSEITCTTRTNCLLLGPVTSPDGSESAEWNGRTWSQPRTFGSESEINALSCVGRRLACLAIDDMGGASWYSQHRWGHRTSHDTPWGDLTNLSCGTTRCLVIDQTGGFVESSGNAWTSPRRAVPHGDFGRHGVLALSCASDTFCLAGDASGGTRRWDGRAWATVARSPLAGSELSCVDPHWCLEIDPFTGSTAVFDGSHWRTRASLGLSREEWAVSCGSRGACVAASNGVVRVLKHGRWSRAYRLPGTTRNSGESVSCSSATFCMVGADYGRTWRWDGHAWRGVPITGFTYTISCPSSTFCAEVGDTGVQVWDGASWTQSTTLQQPDGTAYSYLACASPAYCVVASWTNEVRIGRAA